jgi:nucleoside 2-deoxyribosyltransferase
MDDKAYIAGPLFNEHERWYLEQIDFICRALGIDAFLPHRDAKFASESDTVAIFRADVAGLRSANLVIALLDGQDIDSGTCVELGIAYEHNPRPAIVGITTDTIRRAYSNAMPYAVCMQSLGVVHGLHDLVLSLVRWLEVNKRVSDREADK